MREMYQHMAAITDQRQWGEYALSRDLLQHRITARQRPEMIKEAMACGRQAAARITAEYPGLSVEEIIKVLNIRVLEADDQVIGGRVLFAFYTPPDEITVMKEPLLKYAKMLDQQGDAGILPDAGQIRRLLLGHELFHWIEEHSRDLIYTRTKTITLFKLWRWEYRSGIRALGELAAMHFSQTLNQTAWSPFIVDVLLSYSYDRELAAGIYQDIMKSAEYAKKEENL